MFDKRQAPALSRFYIIGRATVYDTVKPTEKTPRFIIFVSNEPGDRKHFENGCSQKLKKLPYLWFQ